MNDMNNYQIIEVKFLEATDTRGERVRMTSARFGQSITIPYDYKFDGTLNVAINYLLSHGHNVVGKGETTKGLVAVIDATDNQFKPLKEDK